jgi:hypothetical protein
MRTAAPASSTPLFAAWRCQFLPLGRRTPPLVRTLRAATLPQIEARFAQALPAALLAQNAAQAHSRERIFTLARTLWCWLWQILQVNTSCREVVRHVQALFALQRAGAVDEGTGAYCQARAKVPQTLLQKLMDASFASAERAAPHARRALLGGRPIRVVDGSGAHLAETPANRAAFPPSHSCPRGSGFPYLRLVVLFSLASGALLAQASGSLHTGELRLWLALLPRLEPGDILLGDRAYGLYVVAALSRAASVDVILTVPTRTRKVDFRRAQKHLGTGDALFAWRKGKPSAFLEAARWQSLPQELTVRLLRVSLQRPGFRTTSLVLVTTLLDPVLYPAAEIIATHARRWRLEVSLDDLKTTLGMTSLRSQTPAMAHKELLVFLIAHNLIRWVLASAATQESAELERLSFKGALDGFREWSQAMAHCARQPQRCKELWRSLLRSIAADAVPERPGRHEPRAVKKRSKYPHLNRPRDQYVGRPNRNHRRRLARAKKHATRLTA